MKSYLAFFSLVVLIWACDSAPKTENNKETEELPLDTPLVSHIYTADPSAHVFNNRIYVYPSHDIEAGVPEDDLGSHFDMRDYHVLSMDSIGGKVTDHGIGLAREDIPWVGRQLWAPDATEKDGKYYLFFPAKDKEDIFRIGVAISDNPGGPFEPMPEAIEGSYSMDPAVFKDGDTYYMYFGGIWGGQLQRWESGAYNQEDIYPADSAPAIRPRIALMNDDLTGFAETPKEIKIIDENGTEISAGDNDRRFFEAAWVHIYDEKYYLSYSTGDTHKIVYAVGDNPYGPFTYRGVVLNPVIGWTNHHSILEVNGKWYLFYHDSTLSGGKTHLRSVKVKELNYDSQGNIITIDPYNE